MAVSSSIIAYPTTHSMDSMTKRTGNHSKNQQTELMVTYKWSGQYIMKREGERDGDHAKDPNTP